MIHLPLFPHNPHFFITTHSHAFLDKQNPTNNFIVSRTGNTIHARRCADKQELIDIQFRMLGNDLGNLFLPDAILFVEGDTDKLYLQKVLQFAFSNQKIVVESCGSDIAGRLHAWSSALGDLQTGPNRNRTFVVADSVMQSGLERVIDRLGIPAANVVRWDENGIEYLYPAKILSIVFGAHIECATELAIERDRVSAHGMTKTKMDLAMAVVSHITNETEFPNEIQTKLVEPLRKAILPDR